MFINAKNYYYYGYYYYYYYSLSSFDGNGGI